LEEPGPSIFNKEVKIKSTVYREKVVTTSEKHDAIAEERQGAVEGLCYMGLVRLKVILTIPLLTALSGSCPLQPGVLRHVANSRISIREANARAGAHKT
jgi:hypothetical protein